MARRQRYERWYYYRRFKGAMDAMYKCGAWACLLLGFFAGVWFGSFFLGLFFWLAAIIYNAGFIARQQRDLARFWGEGDEAGLGRALKSGFVQYAAFGGIFLIFFCGAISRCNGPSSSVRGPSSTATTDASPAPQSQAPPAKTYSELSAALDEARVRFAKRAEGSIFTVRDAYIRSFEMRGNRPLIRTWANGGKISSVLKSICQEALHERGFEDPLFETEYNN